MTTTATTVDTQPVAASTSTLTLVPPVDVTEDETGVTLTADVPGASLQALQLEVDGQTLTFDAPFTLNDAANVEPVYAEVRAPRYRRSFTFGRDLDTTRIEATLKDGVLQLRVPKLEQARARRIEVRAA
jgi:HSP20 family protein